MLSKETGLILSGVLFAIGTVMHLVLDAPIWMQLLVLVPAYLMVGYGALSKAVRNLGHGNFLDENFLMTIATLGAFAIGMYPEAVAVMLFFQVGEWFEARAVGKTRQSISEMMDIQPDRARVIRDGVSQEVDPEEVSIGELIEILPGERVPLDGTVISGTSTLDTMALTGESLPRDIVPGETIVSGTVNLSSRLVIEVTHEYHDSTVAKVLELMEDSISRKAPAEKFITKFARYYTPAVVMTSAIIAVVPILLGSDPTAWVYRALTFLVVSCPCALVISVPLGYFCGMGAASRSGILVKGSNYLEVLSRIDTVVFDKTGTLTQGRFEITSVHPVGMDGKGLLDIAAAAESASDHPISRIIRESGEYDPASVGDSTTIPGMGVRTMVDGHEISVGNSRLVPQGAVTEEADAGTTIHVSRDGEYLGCIVISDVVKDGSRVAMDGLRSVGVDRIVMLSGDRRSVCEGIGERLGLDEVHGDLLPGDKTAILESMLGSGHTTAFVGDGINDAPSLARADVGIAMGGLGSDVAIEAADVVIMDDDPSKIPKCIGLARKVNRIVYQNIIFALVVKFGIMILTLFGSADMWLAVFGDVGVSVIAILNSMRCLRYDMH